MLFYVRPLALDNRVSTGHERCKTRMFCLYQLPVKRKAPLKSSTSWSWAQVVRQAQVLAGSGVPACHLLIRPADLLVGCEGRIVDIGFRLTSSASSPPGVALARCLACDCSKGLQTHIFSPKMTVDFMLPQCLDFSFAVWTCLKNAVLSLFGACTLM
jgi:hypothetical protein